MDDPDEKALVEKALKSGVVGCVIWHPKEAERVRKQLAHYGLTPEGIQQDTIEYAQKTGSVRQIKETRSDFKHRDYYYKVILPMPDLFQRAFCRNGTSRRGPRRSNHDDSQCA